MACRTLGAVSRIVWPGIEKVTGTSRRLLITCRSLIAKSGDRCLRIRCRFCLGLFRFVVFGFVFARSDDRSYARGAQQVIRRGQRGRAVAVGGLASLVAAVGLSACAGTESNSGHLTLGERVAARATARSVTAPSSATHPSASSAASTSESVTRPSSATPLVPGLPQAEILQRSLTAGYEADSAAAADDWVKAFVALMQVSRTDEWSSPSLTETETGSALASARSQLSSLAEKSYYAQGTTRITGVTVTSIVGLQAKVIGCTSGGERFVERDTGVAAAGVLGSPDPVTVYAEMQKVGSDWKVASQKMEVGQCPL